MKFRGLLTVGATAALAVAAFAMPGFAVAGTAPPPNSPPGSLADFGDAGSRVTVGSTMLGVVPARGTHLRALTATASGTAPAAGCAEPNCNMTYHNGPIQHFPRVYVVFWGPKWNSDPTHQAAAQRLLSFYKGLGQAPADDWSTIESQYGDKFGNHPVLGKSLLAGSIVDTSTPPSTVTWPELGTEAANATTPLHISAANAHNTEVVVASQSGTCFAPPPGDPTGPVFAGNCGSLQSQGGYCAFHNLDTTTNANIFLPWVNLPFQLDAGQGCGQGFVNGANGDLDGFSIVGGHETAETITDPEGTGWNDAKDAVSGGEIADKCAWGGSLWGQNPPDPFGNLGLSTGQFAGQSLWSNVRHGCVMRGALPFTVTPLGTQASITGRPVSVQVHAATRPLSPLTYAASGLPGGLSINRQTGRIGGTPNVTAGTFTVTITVSYYDGSRSFRFTWKVGSPAGQVTGFAAKCVDDAAGRTSNGNKIDISTCNGRAQQRIIFFASGELVVLGKCITGANTAFLEPCTAAASQVWTRRANGEYVLKANGGCLTDPGSSTRDGTRLTLAVCRNTANQRWSLP